jgi:hypothetical protein
MFHQQKNENDVMIFEGFDKRGVGSGGLGKWGNGGMGRLSLNWLKLEVPGFIPGP